MPKNGMKVETVRASADILGEQGLVKVIKSVEEIRLTDGGRQKICPGGPAGEKSAFDHRPRQTYVRVEGSAIKISLGWLRKKGWAAIKAGEIKPIGDAPRGKDEEILETLLNGPKSSADAGLEKGLADLKSRGLDEISKSKDGGMRSPRIWAKIRSYGIDPLSLHVRFPI